MCTHILYCPRVHMYHKKNTSTQTHLYISQVMIYDDFSEYIFRVYLDHFRFNIGVYISFVCSLED